MIWVVDNSVAAQGQTQQQNNDFESPSYPKDKLEDFLEKNPNCSKVVNERGKKLGLGSYEDIVSNVPITNGANTELANKQVPWFNGTESNPPKTINEYYTRHPSIYGVTTYYGQFPQISITRKGAVASRIGPKWLADPLNTGEVVFHETLHAYFYAAGRNSHAKIVEALGINFTFVKPPDFDSFDVKKQNDVTDAQNVTAITTWILNGCKNSNTTQRRGRR